MPESQQRLAAQWPDFRLDEWLVRPQLGRMERGGEILHLRPKSMAVLVYLAAAKGKVVARNELLDAVWPNQAVTDDVLTQSVLELRNAFGDQARTPRFVETIPKVGLRLIPPVVISEEEANAAPVHAFLDRLSFRHSRALRTVLPVAAAALIGGGFYWYWTDRGAAERQSVESVNEVKSVAVLPFLNMSDDPKQEYFSDGVTEEILNALASIDGLRVVGRTSSFYFKDRNETLQTIGEMLNVEHLVEGSVRKSGDRVRIAVQLIDVRTDDHLWSRTYDRELGDIFAIQEDIATSVAGALEITLGVGELGQLQGMTSNVAAYEDYLLARSLRRGLDLQDWQRAIELLERAVSLDPEFGLAWNYLGLLYFDSAILLPSRRTEFIERGVTAATRVMAVAPESLASLYAATQLHLLRHEWAAAEEALKQVLKRAPADYLANGYYAALLANVGRPGEAMTYAQRAFRGEPLSVISVQSLALVQEMGGDLEEALRGYEAAKALATEKCSFPNALVMTFAMGIRDRALMEASMENCADNEPASQDPIRSIFITLGSLLDAPETARKALHDFEDDPAYNSPLVRTVMAQWASYFGDDEFALELYDQPNQEIVDVAYDLWRPIHGGVRRLPGFKNLVRDLGLEDYWRTTGKWAEFCQPLGDNDFTCE